MFLCKGDNSFNNFMFNSPCNHRTVTRPFDKQNVKCVCVHNMRKSIFDLIK